MRTMSSPTSSKRRVRGELSRDQILEAALELIDRVGHEGLTMRRLASELQCGTMTLYSHVAGRDDLLSGVVGLFIKTMDLRYIAGESWQDCARRTVQSYRALAYEHPRAFELLGLATIEADPVAPYFERLLWLFQKGGLSEEAARAFLSVADGFASGFLLYECRSLVRSRQLSSWDDEHERETAYLAELHGMEAFDVGFEVLIRGIEAMFPRSCQRQGGGPESRIVDSLDSQNP